MTIHTWKPLPRSTWLCCSKCGQVRAPGHSEPVNCPKIGKTTP